MNGVLWWMRLLNNLDRLDFSTGVDCLILGALGGDL